MRKGTREERKENALKLGEDEFSINSLFFYK